MRNTDKGGLYYWVGYLNPLKYTEDLLSLALRVLRTPRYTKGKGPYFQTVLSNFRVVICTNQRPPYPLVPPRIMCAYVHAVLPRVPERDATGV